MSRTRTLVDHENPEEPEASAPSLTGPQARIVAAAQELFAQRGVGGTSLQMIADAIGVTKAALFYQFKTKDDIVLAAADDELSRLEAVVDAAERVPRTRRRQVVLSGMVDLSVDRRRTVSVIMSDPVVLRFFADDERYQRVLDRLTDLLMGPGAEPHRHLQTAMFMAALSGAVMHPMMADIDDDTLRCELLRLARRFR
ncbi:MAG TPA: helix-turn-helix domain-containing protein [Acidimicrobiales bacterium]|nr:helix-turn-helix domain-containing protein [Acidimicrobiales bacterium]